MFVYNTQHTSSQSPTQPRLDTSQSVYDPHGIFHKLYKMYNVFGWCGFSTNIASVMRWAVRHDGGGGRVRCGVVRCCTSLAHHSYQRDIRIYGHGKVESLYPYNKFIYAKIVIVLTSNIFAFENVSNFSWDFLFGYEQCQTAVATITILLWAELYQMAVRPAFNV